MDEKQIAEFSEDDRIVPLDQQESEDDVHLDKGETGDAVLFNTDWTVETLFRQIEKGNINLDPHFQRRAAWDAIRKSKFIESILCGFPIPNVVLAEDKRGKGRYLVIDGKQRLFAITSFLKDSFELRDLEIRGDLNNQKFSQLKGDDVNALENFSIRTVIIRNWPSEEYLYSVFYRLNSGSLPLSPQELRKALHGGVLLDYLDDYIKASTPFQNIFGSTPDPRMRDVELVLRFVAFEHGLDQYDGNLKKFLDRAVIEFDENWQMLRSKVDEYLKALDFALSLASEIFEKDVFKKWNAEKEVYERRVNRAIFDVIVRNFSNPSLADISRAKKHELVTQYRNLCENLDFRNAIERTTKTPAATRARYRLWGELLAKILAKNFDEKSMRVI